MMQEEKKSKKKLKFFKLNFFAAKHFSDVPSTAGQKF